MHCEAVEVVMVARIHSALLPMLLQIRPWEGERYFEQQHEQSQPMVLKMLCAWNAGMRHTSGNTL